eukprot:m.30165 g.30165  ORF g.30165 m.30165 type:complete len:359 (-) comp12189_c0_seq1:220-1296(-)
MADGRELVLEGVHLYGLARFAEAVVVFKRAAAVTPVAPVGAFVYMYRLMRSHILELPVELREAAEPWLVRMAEREAELRQRAEAQPPDALDQFLLALCLQEGIAMRRDTAQAAEFYQRAVDQGWAPACCNLGLMRLKESAADSADRAVALFRRGAELGHASAACSLGWCYLASMGVPFDEDQGFFWIKKAADQQYPPALSNLGACCTHGWGVPRSRERAEQAMLQAAQLGDTRGMCMLAQVRLQSGAAAATAEALAWLHRAADLGEGDALHKLSLYFAERHSRGGGSSNNSSNSDADLASAAKYLRRAAGLGHTASMEKLGTALATGTSMPSDRRQAVYWLRRSQSRSLFSSAQWWTQ